MARTRKDPVGAATPIRAGNVARQRDDATSIRPTLQPWSEPPTYVAAAKLALGFPEVITPAESRFCASIAVQPEWRPVPAGKAARLEGIIDRLRRHVDGGTP